MNERRACNLTYERVNSESTILFKRDTIRKVGIRWSVNDRDTKLAKQRVHRGFHWSRLPSAARFLLVRGKREPASGAVYATELFNFQLTPRRAVPELFTRIVSVTRRRDSLAGFPENWIKLASLRASSRGERECELQRAWTERASL